MKPYKILTIDGDGIGPEIMAATRPILESVLKNSQIPYELTAAKLGGQAIDEFGEPYPQDTQMKAKEADGILFGAIGGPKWDSLPRHLRPETGLLKIREDLRLFANLRPALIYPELVGASSLKSDLVSNLDMLIVRELTGGIYFGQPRGVEQRDGESVGFNTMVYSESEIRRVAQVAFSAAVKRSGKLCSVDKANVLEVSQLWRDVVNDEAQYWPGVELSHMYVDNCAMQFVRSPKQFDVVLTSNLFGDILSDVAAMLTGSIGMLPSASLDVENKGLYEPVHGSAPDIAGHGKANPLACILSCAMMLRYSFDLIEESKKIEDAVARVLAAGFRTPDILEAGDNYQLIGTQAMGEQVLKLL